MSNFILQHRKSEEIYTSVNEARNGIRNANTTFEDGEIIISRYKDGDSIKSVLGVCNAEGGKASWSVFSYDDDLIAQLQVEGGDVDLSAYVKKDDFSAYKETTSSDLNNKVNKTAYEKFTGETNTSLQGKATYTYVDDNAVRQGTLNGYELILENIKGKQLDTIDLSSLVNKGMVDRVEIDDEEKELVITWNADADNKVTRIKLSDIFNPSNYYDKSEVDTLVESKHVFFEKYEDYEESARQTGVTYYIEDKKIISHNDVEFKSMCWAYFIGDNEEEYMPIAVYNKATQTVEVRNFSEIEELSSSALEGITPIGVVVIPKDHNVYGDGSCGVMSLVYMSCETPDVGNIGKSVGNGGAGGDGTHYICFGNNEYAKNASAVKIPHLGVMGDGTNKNPVASTKQGTTNQKVAIPNDKDPGVASIIDPYGKYPDNNGSDRYYGIPPYEGYDEQRNPMYSSDSLATYDGEEKTKEILELATAQSNWQTSSTLVNDSTNGYYPAACACWRFNPEGTEQGDWYLPCAAELGYVIARTNKINNTLLRINSVFGVEYANDIDYMNKDGYNIWSTTPHSTTSMVCYGTGTSVLVSTAMDGKLGSARAFLKLKV